MAVFVLKVNNNNSHAYKMATQGDIQSTQTFPNPPSAYYSLYTDENVESGLAPKPPKPIKGAYQMFGAPFEVCLTS